MNILVLNCGSSSLKFQLIQIDEQSLTSNSEAFLAKGLIERIGSQALIRMQGGHTKPYKSAQPIRNHKQAIDFVIRWLISDDSQIDEVNSLSDIHAVGHRVVHGGEHFKQSVLIDESVIDGIEDCIDLAPLHNPSNLSGIAAVKEIMGPSVPQVAVFDTAFHMTMPDTNYLYPIPYQFYRRHKVRRYGFHGTSHRYISYRYRQLFNLERNETFLITLHLGNGCSACAIAAGQSVDTSMGMTPLEGLTMGTRAGDIDPAILEFLHLKEGMSYENLFNMLNKQSGLLGISGLTNDMRELIEEEEENHDRRANLAINIFCNRVKKYIGAYLASMPRVDALVFAGGIGENAALIRSRICQGLAHLGLEIDEDKNYALPPGGEGSIASDQSQRRILVIPTNEELLIARDTFRCIGRECAHD